MFEVRANALQQIMQATQNEIKMHTGKQTEDKQQTASACSCSRCVPVHCSKSCKQHKTKSSLIKCECKQRVNLLPNAYSYNVRTQKNELESLTKTGLKYKAITTKL